MANLTFSTKSLVFTLFVLVTCFLPVFCSTSDENGNRETLEIVIGIGGGGGGGGGGNYGNCPPQPGPSLIFADERLAVVYPVIQKFKNLITFDPFGITNNWVGSDICKYKGFYCDNPPDNETATALASVDFNGFQLGAPTLDGFLDQLPDIALFHANSNNFTGTISPKISQLQYLYELDISNNKFCGVFPTAVLGMNNLSFLDIRYNSFAGSVPPQIFTQTLDVLFLNNNNFMQKLPDNLGNSPVLYLTLANNKFTGPIPRSIGKACATLIEVLFLNNLLSGCLPYEIGYLKEAKLFDASQNQLTGPIPCSFGCLEKMELLNFAGNQLYGQIPEVVCALANLVNFSLSDNYFTQAGPLCRRLIKRGVLDVRKNCILDLPEQRSAVECGAFFSHPRVCPYLASYSFVPCKLPSSPFGPKTSPHSLTPSTAPSPSYAALVKHRP